MSVSINQFTTVEVPEDKPLAICREGELTIWPQGFGSGPSIRMDAKDWSLIWTSVTSAIALDATQGKKQDRE